MRRRLLALVVVALTASALAGCGSDAESEGDGAETPAIHAEIRRSRLFETQRQLKLVLRNDEATAVAVDSLQLDSPLFERVDAQARPSSLAPGRAVSIPVDFGASVCGEDAEGDSFIVLSIEGEQQRLRLEEPTGDVTGLHERECETERIFEAFDLGFGEDLTSAGQFAVQTTLDLDRLEDVHTLDVDQVRGSVVISLQEATGGLPSIALDEGEDRASVDVIFNASRCDSHALTESKKTFVFVAFVHLDGGPAIRLELPAEGALREELERYIEACH